MTKKIIEKHSLKNQVKKNNIISKSNSSSKSIKAKRKKIESFEDTDIVIVDEDFGIDKEKELEARRAYLEEARSQEASDD